MLENILYLLGILTLTLIIADTIFMIKKQKKESELMEEILTDVRKNRIKSIDINLDGNECNEDN